ncbi:methylglyoxal reductase (NADPH-dependent) gre2 [Tulasnella sp. 332]|nr:methylglyoxal reductase (NADPH-dependent) gre2 [Tulasnella sp. 332]
MPIVSAPAKVLVTGASGFIAVWLSRFIVSQYPDNPPRFTQVRSTAKGEYLARLYEQYGFGKDRFNFVIVEDMAKEGAFDEAVIGVDAVEHTASPMAMATGGPQGTFNVSTTIHKKFIASAVQGTTEILKSVKEHGKSVKRVIVTSSVTTILSEQIFKPVPGQNVALDESNWNTFSVKEVEEKGKDADPMHIYRASKVLAERAAWSFMADNKNSIAFDLVTAVPTIVYGPMIHDVAPSPDALSGSMKIFRGYTSLPEKSEKEVLGPINSSGYWADVRDVAAIHALALANPNAGGERFITCSGPNSLQNVLDAIHTGLSDSTGVAKGLPGQGNDFTVNGKIITTKAQKAFNYRFRSVEDTAPEAIKSLKEKGCWEAEA